MSAHDRADEILRGILAEARGKIAGSSRRCLSADDRDVLARMIENIESGSQAVFVTFNDDATVDYLIANASRAEGIDLALRFARLGLKRLGEREKGERE
jgi:hypothetical protein